MSGYRNRWEVPDSWSWAQFSEVADIVQNLVTPNEVQNESHIAPNNIEAGTRKLLPYNTVADDAVISPKNRFVSGQILFSKIRPYLLKAVKVNFSGVCSADMYPIWARPEIDTNYLLYWLTSADFRDEIAHRQGRTVLPKINQKDLNEILIPIPPASEQKRISSKIDSLFYHSSRAKIGINQVISLSECYKTAILRVHFDGNNQVHTNIMSYVSEKIRNGLSVAGSDFPPGVPALKLSALRSDAVDLDDVRYLQIDAERARRFFIAPGDILISRGNGALRLVGKAAIVPHGCEGIIFPDTAFRIRPNPAVVDARWLLWMWNAPQIRSQIEAVARTTAGIWKISQTDISSFLLPKISLEEQRRIVRHIEAAFSAIDQAAVEAESARALVERLEFTILAKAFRGELVPQDPDDEPASVLLDRIQAERAADGLAPKRARRPRTASRA